MSPENEHRDGVDEAADQPEYIIEGARSGRSRCKTCRRQIEKGGLRLGVLIEGPFGTGYLWHHLACAARRMFDRVEEAYEAEAWANAKTPPANLPELVELRALRAKAEERQKQRKTIPYAELSPSGRARCRQCDEPLPKGEVRIVVGQLIEFGSQTRVGPRPVHPRCVAEALEAPDSATEKQGLAERLRANSGELPVTALDAAIEAIGPLD
jgi:hypothetical protein